MAEEPAVIEQQVRLDGILLNELTQLGMAKEEATRIKSNRMLGSAELEQLYVHSWFCRRVVDLFASCATRAGWEISLGEEMNDRQRKQAAAMRSYGNRLKIKAYMREGIRLARLYGGSAVLLKVDDGRTPLREPINWKRLKSIKGLYALDRHRISPSPGWSGVGTPDLYQITTRRDADMARAGFEEAETETQVDIHWSRVLRLEGEYLPERQRAQTQWWGGSVLQTLWNVFRRYETGQQSAADILHDFDLVVHKIDGLAEMLTQPGGDEALRNRMQANAMARSVMGTYLLDTKEDLQGMKRSAAGVDGIMDRLKTELTAASRLPHTKLWGESPGGGLSSNGRSEDQAYAEEMKTWQEESIADPLRQFYGTAMRCSDSGWKGEPPDDWEIEFTSIYVLTDAEQAELYGKMATGDTSYVNAQVLRPNEIALARFGQPKFSLGMTLIDREPDGSIKVEEQNPDEIAFGGDLATPDPNDPAAGQQGAGQAGDGQQGEQGAIPSQVPAGGPDGGLDGAAPDDEERRGDAADSRDDGCCPACDEEGTSCSDDERDDEEEDHPASDHPDSVGRTMHRWKRGGLHSGTGKAGEHRGVVKAHDQAVAIALSIAEREADRPRRRNSEGRRRRREDSLPAPGRRHLAGLTVDVLEDGTGWLVGPYGQRLDIPAAVGPALSGLWEVRGDSGDSVVLVGAGRGDAEAIAASVGATVRALDGIDLISMGVRCDAFEAPELE